MVTAVIIEVPLDYFRPGKTFLTIWTREWAVVVVSSQGMVDCFTAATFEVPLGCIRPGKAFPTI